MRIATAIAEARSAKQSTFRKAWDINMTTEQYRTSREEPTVCYCERELDLAPGAQYGPVNRNVYIIECCTEGYGSVIINGHEFPVGPGDCYILLPGDTIIHTADPIQPRRGVWCSIDGLAMGRHLRRAGITAETPFAPPDAFEELCGWVEQIICLWEQGEAGGSPRLTSCIYGFLGTLLREKTGMVSGTDWAERAIGLMESRYHEPLSVSQIAKEIGLERAYFSTLFKSRTGESPYRYLTSLRIRKACVLLENPSCSISEVAESVGLDSRNFARLFQKETGQTPFKYKKSVAKAKSDTYIPF